MFRGSLRENVALGRPGVGESDVRAALERAGLLDASSSGSPTVSTRPLGEGGRGLSAGERRRLSLARAILRDAPLLAARRADRRLDLATERSVLESLREAGRERTVLIVTHRPAPLELCDRVVTLGHEAVAA